MAIYNNEFEKKIARNRLEEFWEKYGKLALSRIPLRKTKLEKEDLKLSIEERKLNIELMKQELKNKG